MKKVLIPFLSIFILVLAFVVDSEAQSVKSQTEHIKSLKLGKYISYEVKKKKDSDGFFYAPFSLEMELLEVNRENSFPEHTYLVFDDESSYNKSYMPDNMAFPATLAQVGYLGNEKLQKAVGYVADEIRTGSTQRIVVIDGVIFNITTKFTEDGTQTIKPFTVYVHESFKDDGEEKKDDGKKKKQSFKEKMKMLKAAANGNLSDKAGNKLSKMDAVGMLRNYLTKAVAEQKKTYSTWSKVPSNATRIKLLEEKKELMYAAINKYNDDLKDTDEWRRIQENNRFWEANEKANVVTIKNSTGRDVWLYEENSMNGTVIRVNSSGKFDCKTTYYYTFDGNSGTRGGNVGSQAYASSSSCGGTVSIK